MRCLQCGHIDYARNTLRIKVQGRAILHLKPVWRDVVQYSRRKNKATNRRFLKDNNVEVQTVCK